MKESALVRKIKAAVRKAYPRAYVVKLADAYHRGLPDLLIQYEMVPPFVDERFPATLYIETKTAGGRLAPIQKAEHAKIRRAGGVVLVARGVAEVLATLKQEGAVP